MRSSRPAAWLSFALFLLISGVVHVPIGQGFPPTRDGDRAALRRGHAEVAAGTRATKAGSLAVQKPAAPLGAAAIPNPSFEETDGKAPVGWRTSRFSGQAEHALDSSVAHTGQRSVRITAANGADVAWSVVVPLKPYSTYRLTAFIKTDNVQAGTGKGALLNLHNIQAVQTPAVTGTSDWTPVDVTFETKGYDAVQLNCLLGGWGRSTGTAWFDDVTLELLETRALKPQVVIDPAQRKAPLSKYVYGQFIEHLGRCIYGGIWAEMLEDRKFYYAIGSKDTPWKAAGEPAVIVMNPIEALVGAHSPEVRLRGDGRPGGLAQEALALVNGKRYEGRVALAGSPDAAPIRVALVWGEAPGDCETVTIAAIGHTYRTFPVSFTAKAGTERGRLEIVGTGRGAFRVGTASLMPADHVQGFRPDTLQLLRELNAPVYRWPGGNFVSGYNWRDGIGDRDRRPPRKNPAWQGVEHNDVGIHEFMALCELIGTEPYVAVNSGFGDAAMAADEVEYVNGAASTPMGKLRAANGHEQPYACKWWSIGNEMYGNWQLGHMPVGDYVPKHNEFARAMKARDPSIRLIGVGEVGAWDETMLAGAAAQMDLVSEHFYCQESPGLMGHVAQIPNQIRRIAEAHRKYRKTIPALKGLDLPVAMDEWNYWYGPHLYGELGTRYFLKDALGIAAGFNEYARQSDIIFMANYAQTVNVIGAIKTTKTAAALEATGVVLKLYRERFGSIPVEVRGAPEPLDVAAAWRDDGQALVLSIVNPTATPQTLALDIAGWKLPATGRLWRIAGRDERAYNEPGKPPAITVQETPAAPLSKAWVVPPMSISLLELGSGVIKKSGRN
jgi:alpha-N-arabinofuranosidase